MDRTGTNLDAIDRAIIEQLQADGRVPYTRLGAAVGLSEAAARQRVQRLIDAGVLQVVGVTNPLSVGRRRMAMIGVRSSGPTDELAAALRRSTTSTTSSSPPARSTSSARWSWPTTTS